MNYYIQGNKEKAEEIKAAFEKLGYDISWPEGCANPDVINIGVERNGAKYVVAETSEYIKDIIKTHPDYKELELAVKSKFKVGDWIVRNNGSSDIPIQVYGLKKDRYLVTNMLGSKGQLMINRQDEWRLWAITDAKDGDVLAADECYVIFKEIDGLNIKCYCTYHYMGFNPSFYIDTLQNKTAFHPATQKERYQLFKGMREAGYQWYAGKKELCRIIEPKFKVGDGIKTGNTIDTIAEIDYATRSYCCESGRTIWFENQDLWHLVSKPHYDISNFHAGMPVLVRDGDCDDDDWTYALFSHYNSTRNEYKFLASGNIFSQCIPYNDDTKHLLGTTDMPSEEFINW